MNEDFINQIVEECRIRNVTEKTTGIYTYNATKFLEWAGDKPASAFTLNDAREYILYRRNNGASPGYCNSMCSALSFFFRHILHIPWDLDIIPRMKMDWVLPHTLTLDEVERLIDTAQNVRNKAIIALLYSSGLRAGEIARLAPSDIYKSTMQVHIRNGKNRGDHWTILSERALDLLTEYWYSYPVKRDFLFVTLKNPHKPLHVGGIEAMLKRVGADAGIDVHPHTLRHSFATHLIEHQTSREYVQAMLGHRSSSTTELYIHISNKSLLGVKSPLDLHGKDVENE